MKKIGLLLLLLAVAGTGAYWYLGDEQTATTRYRLAEVTKGEIRRIVSSTGTINPLNTVNVGSQISGNIKKILVDFNSPVKKQQLIALIDDSVYAAQVGQARAKLLMAEAQLREREKDVIAAEANINNAQANIENIRASIQSAEAGIRSAEANLFSARSSLKLAEAQYQRQKSLLQKSVATQADVDAAETALDRAEGAVSMATAQVQAAQADLQSAHANLKASEARLQSANAQQLRSQSQVKGAAANIVDKQAALDLAQIQLKYCKIRSPINGIVIHRNVEVGQTVAATLQSPTLFIIAEDLSSMQLEVDVSESDVGLVKQGQHVTFTVDAFPDNTFKAVLQQIRNQPTSVQNVVTYKIIASVKNEKLLLRPGMTANVSIEVAHVAEVLKVPNAALRFKPAEQKETATPGSGDKGKNRMLTRLTKQLALNEAQAAELGSIIETEGKKLAAVARTTEDETARKEAFQKYMKAVITQLFPLLTPDQSETLNRLLAEWRRAVSGDKKRGEVHVLDNQGQPKSIRILSGISNETETQIISRDLNAGDRVIVGIDFSAGAATNSGPSNPFMPGRRRR